MSSSVRSESSSPALKKQNGPSEDESSPAANQDSAEERSLTERASPQAGSTGRNPASSSDDSSSDDSDEDVHQGALKKIRSSVAQIKRKG